MSSWSGNACLVLVWHGVIIVDSHLECAVMHTLFGQQIWLSKTFIYILPPLSLVILYLSLPLPNTPPSLHKQMCGLMRLTLTGWHGMNECLLLLFVIIVVIQGCCRRRHPPQN